MNEGNHRWFVKWVAKLMRRFQKVCLTNSLIIIGVSVYIKLLRSYQQKKIELRNIKYQEKKVMILLFAKTNKSIMLLKDSNFFLKAKSIAKAGVE